MVNYVPLAKVRYKTCRAKLLHVECINLVITTFGYLEIGRYIRLLGNTLIRIMCRILRALRWCVVLMLI